MPYASKIFLAYEDVQGIKKKYKPKVVIIGNIIREEILNFKKKTNYKMVYSKQNENINNELFALYGKHDKNFAIGKYFHQINANLDDIRRSSNLILS